MRSQMTKMAWKAHAHLYQIFGATALSKPRTAVEFSVEPNNREFSIGSSQPHQPIPLTLTSAIE